MKFGIYYAYWEKEWGGDYRPYVQRVKKLGFDILEIACGALLDTPEAELDELREMAKAHGVLLTAGYGPRKEHNIASDDPAVVEGAIGFYARLFAVLDRLDIRQIGGGLYSYWPVDYSKPVDKAADRARSIAGVRKMADLAAPYGITLGMEVLNRFEGYLLNTAEEAVAFVGEVGRDNVGVMLDTFHMNIEEDSFGDAIRTAGKRLVHFHIGEANRRVPGQGRIPWQEIAGALADIGYDGAVVMEPFVRMGGGIGSDIKIWREIVADENRLDPDAAASVQFVRSLFDGLTRK